MISQAEAKVQLDQTLTAVQEVMDVLVNGTAEESYDKLLALPTRTLVQFRIAYAAMMPVNQIVATLLSVARPAHEVRQVRQQLKDECDAREQERKQRQQRWQG